MFSPMVMAYIVITNFINGCGGFGYSSLIQLIPPEQAILKDALLKHVFNQVTELKTYLFKNDIQQNLYPHFIVSSLFFFVESSVDFYGNVRISYLTAMGKRVKIKYFQNDTVYNHFSVYHVDVNSMIKTLHIEVISGFVSFKIFKQSR